MTTPPLPAISPRDHIQFDAAGRMVIRLHRSEEAELLLVCWEPRQASSMHEHGRSESIITVLEGVLTAVDEAGREQAVAAGGVSIAPRGRRHQLRNDSAERAVSLHVYSPPLRTPISAPFRDLLGDDGNDPVTGPAGRPS